MRARDRSELRSLTFIVLLLVASLILPGLEGVGLQRAVEYRSFVVEPVGEARLELRGEDRLIVSNLGPEGRDGIRVSLEGLTEWAVEIEGPDNEDELPLGNAIEAHFYDDSGQMVIRLREEKFHDPEYGDAWLVLQNLYGESYTAEVYDSGELLFSEEIPIVLKEEQQLVPIGTFGYSEKGLMTLKDVHYNNIGGTTGLSLCYTTVACPGNDIVWCCLFPPTSVCSHTFYDDYGQPIYTSYYKCGEPLWCKDSILGLSMCPLPPQVQVPCEQEVDYVELYTKAPPDSEGKLWIDSLTITDMSGE